MQRQLSSRFELMFIAYSIEISNIRLYARKCQYILSMIYALSHKL